MALSVATGRCRRRMADAVPGFRPVDPERVLLVGARDLDPAERAELREAGVEGVAPGAFDRLSAALDRLRERVEEVYLHVDMDVLDPGEGTVNGYAAPDGLSLAQARAAVRAVRERFRVRAATLSAYDPAFDLDGRARAAGLEILGELARP
jgi:arginase